MRTVDTDCPHAAVFGTGKKYRKKYIRKYLLKSLDSPWQSAL